MPELPEVQCVVDRLAPNLRGQLIRNAAVYWPKTVVSPTRERFITAIVGMRCVNVRRRAKFLVFELKRGSDRHFLIAHLRMSGRLRWHLDNETQRHERVRITFNSGSHLSFVDPRKFGRMWLVDNPDAVLGQLGPEPLDEAFDSKALFALLHERRTMLKPLLLNQRVLAGLGNIYVDESLWRSKLHPLTPGNALTADDAGRLYRAIRQTLQLAIARQGTDNGDGVIEFGVYKPQVYGREGCSCRRCRTPIIRLTVGQRGTHVCPLCQKRSVV